MSKEQQVENLYQFDEQYRDTLTTVDHQGKRVWLFPKKQKGRFYSARVLVSSVLMLLFFIGPFLEWNDHPFLLFNFFDRRFIIFGQVFWPQDFFLIAITLVTLFVFIILFTVAFGRIWCGWACPQTLFLEMVFRKIEYWIEGDAPSQRRLHKSSWTSEKIIKKGIKHFIYILIALMVSHTVMSYLIGFEETKHIITESPMERLGGFAGLIFFSFLFYIVFAWFREQACIAVCPYGRLQSVLLVKESLVIIYDWLRGEPRGKLSRRKTESKTGDCIDCKLCVYVCPTGIDIRNGTQLECVNCTACIDACDEVMVKINKPKGLIRYASHKGITDGIQRIFTPRVIGYSVVLVVMISLLSFFVTTRDHVEVTVLKTPGTLYSRGGEGLISNVYNVEFFNKTFDDISLELKIENPPQASLIKVGAESIQVPHEGAWKGLFIVKIPESDILDVKTIVELGVYEMGNRIKKVKVSFIGPLK